MKLKCKLYKGYVENIGGEKIYTFIFIHKKCKIEVCLEMADIKKLGFKLRPNQFYILEDEKGFTILTKSIKPKSEIKIKSFIDYYYGKLKPKVLKLNDDGTIKAENYDLFNFPFDFNPAQTKVFPHIFEDKNMIVCSPTASGKTVMAEMTAGIILKMGLKVIYLSPLKALGEEKFIDWGDQNHFFSNYKLSILTGDYSLTASRKKELNDANIICMTSEMLDSKTRMIKDNGWLKKVGLIVCDEFHLVGVQGRGDKLETALMRFFEFNKMAKFIGLSATLPNVNDTRIWIERLTGKTTELIMSDYRPCKLDMHFVEIPKINFNYTANQQTIMTSVFSIVRQFPDDKFLVFVSSKKFGRKLEQEFLSRGITQVAFHNADKNKQHRKKIETEFKNPIGKIKYLISTTTLAWGVNLPSRRVIVCHVEIGRTDISGFDIQQMSGRAGRPRYDKKGDAYLLCPSDRMEFHKNRILSGEKIHSQLCDIEVLEFHILGEIYNNKNYNLKTFQRWFNKSLASVQSRVLDEHWIEAIFRNLKSMSMIKEVNGRYQLTNLGRVSVMLYFYPKDVYSWKNSFDVLFKYGNEDNDLLVCKALSERELWKKDYITKDEKKNIKGYVDMLDDKTLTGSLKYGATIWKLINGQPPRGLNIYSAMIKGDINRIISLLKLIDNWYSRWGKTDFFDTLALRIQYGVDKKLLNLVDIKGVGKVYATKLSQYNILTNADILKPSNYSVIKMILKRNPDDIIKQVKTLEKNK